MTDTPNQHEGDPSLRRVIFDLQGEHLSELMIELGGFTLAREIELDIKDAPVDATHPSIEIADNRYDPSLVVWRFDPDTGARVAVTTRAHLRDVAKKEFDNSHAGAQLHSSITRTQNYPHKFSSLKPYLHIEGDHIKGLRTAKIPLLISEFHANTISLLNQGKRSVDLLERYYAAVIRRTPQE